MKILIVEDDKDLREITTTSLEKERYVVSQAPDYRTALQKIEDYDYDCILLDIMLPDGNGLDLLQELHDLGKKTSVIILSARDSLEDKVQGLDLGADDYLPKPFHLAELHARIKSLLRRNQREGDRKVQFGNIELFPDSYDNIRISCYPVNGYSHGDISIFLASSSPASARCLISMYSA